MTKRQQPKNHTQNITEGQNNENKQDDFHKQQKTQKTTKLINTHKRYPKYKLFYSKDDFLYKHKLISTINIFLKRFN